MSFVMIIVIIIIAMVMFSTVWKWKIWKEINIKYGVINTKRIWMGIYDIIFDDWGWLLWMDKNANMEIKRNGRIYKKRILVITSMGLYAGEAHSEEHNHQQSLLMLGYKALKCHIASHTFNPLAHYFNYTSSYTSIIHSSINIFIIIIIIFIIIIAVVTIWWFFTLTCAISNCSKIYFYR